MRNALSVLVTSLLIAAAAGCSCGVNDQITPSDEDGGEGTADSGITEEDAGVDAGLQFLSRTEAYRDAGMIFELIEYESQGLLIKGEICRPEDDGTVAHPLVLRNHNGWTGLGLESFDSLCLQLADRGMVVASSAYRGEGGSEGKVEFCLGEVEDVRRLMAIMQRQPFVSADRVGMVGAGHGGCITLQAAAVEPELDAVVDIDGYGDLAAAHKFWDRQIQYNEPPPCPADGGDVCSFQHAQHLNAVETAIGGRPSGFPLSYAVRSPTPRLSSIKAPLLMVQAELDIITHYTQACAKREELQSPTLDGGVGRTVTAWYLDDNQNAATPTISCSGAFQSGAAPDPKVAGTLDGSQTYLFVMGNQPFPYKGRGEDHVRGLVLRFLVDRLTAP